VENAPAAPIYQLKVTLAEVGPPVWRRIRVRGDLSLERLHAVVQRAMGWHDSHLHEWTVEGRRYGQPEADEPEYEADDERKVTFREAAPVTRSRFEYLYDLGDSWTHEVVVEKIEPPDPQFRFAECLGGERACPPEDCGGLHGYYNLIKTLADLKNPEREEMLEWLGAEWDAERFDLAEINSALKRLKA